MEVAVRDLVNLITKGYVDRDMVKIDQFIDRVAQEYSTLTFESVVQSVKLSMEHIKKRLTSTATAVVAVAADEGKKTVCISDNVFLFQMSSLFLTAEEGSPSGSALTVVRHCD